MPIVKQQMLQTIADSVRQGARDFAHVLAGLENVSPDSRRWSARELAAFPAASEALVERVKREGNPSVRAAILTTLTQLGDDVAVAGLAKFLRSEDAALRNEAVEAMKQLPEKVAPIIGGLLSDPDPDVRIFAVNILESLRHPQVEGWLINVIESEPHVNVCGTAVDLLGEVGTEASCAALYHLKERFSGEPYIQFAADLAIKRIGED